MWKHSSADSSTSDERPAHHALAVVLISRNQEWNVRRLIDSVVAEVAGCRSADILLVDSASSDRTVEYAMESGIRIIRLKEGQPLTAAAGRYVGTKRTESDWVLFLDGDMELFPGWVDLAIRVLEEQSDVAAVTGRVIDLPKGTVIQGSPPPPDGPAADYSEIVFCGGAAIYRRSALEEVGTFNPYLYSDEEPELCLRIRQAGYRVVRLRHPIALHYTDPRGDVSTWIARRRRNLYLGFGQVIRHHLRDEILQPYLSERGFGVAPTVTLVLGFVALLWALAGGGWAWLFVWMFLGASGVGWGIAKKGSLRGAASGLLHRLFIVDGMIRGFLLTPRSADSYPEEIELMQ